MRSTLHYILILSFAAEILQWSCETVLVKTNPEQLMAESLP